MVEEDLDMMRGLYMLSVLQTDRIHRVCAYLYSLGRFRINDFPEDAVSFAPEPDQVRLGDAKLDWFLTVRSILCFERRRLKLKSSDKHFKLFFR